MIRLSRASASRASTRSSSSSPLAPDGRASEPLPLHPGFRPQPSAEPQEPSQQHITDPSSSHAVSDSIAQGGQSSTSPAPEGATAAAGGPGPRRSGGRREGTKNWSPAEKDLLIELLRERVQSVRTWPSGTSEWQTLNDEWNRAMSALDSEHVWREGGSRLKCQEKFRSLCSASKREGGVVADAELSRWSRAALLILEASKRMPEARSELPPTSSANLSSSTPTMQSSPSAGAVGGAVTSSPSDERKLSLEGPEWDVFRARRTQLNDRGDQSITGYHREEQKEERKSGGGPGPQRRSEPFDVDSCGRGSGKRGRDDDELEGPMEQCLARLMELEARSQLREEEWRLEMARQKAADRVREHEMRMHMAKAEERRVEREEEWKQRQESRWNDVLSIVAQALQARMPPSSLAHASSQEPPNPT